MKLYKAFVKSTRNIINWILGICCVVCKSRNIGLLSTSSERHWYKCRNCNSVFYDNVRK